jgi:hypothetical protein
MSSNRSNKIKVNSYVKLKNGFDEIDVYRNVDAGATGWVRESKVDDDGFAMIFVEWDESNPKYAGEIDKWAFESHFEIVSEKYQDGKTSERYIENIRIATDAALASDGFFLITVRKHKSAKGIDIYEPQVHSGNLEDDIAFIIEAQIAHLASTLFQDYIQDTLNALKIKDKTENPILEFENEEEDEDDESGR